MATNISLSNIIEKNRLHSDSPYLILLDVSVIDPATGAHVEMLRLVRNPENIVFEKQTYQAFNFDIDVKMEAGSQPQVSIAAVDYTRAIQARMQAYGGGIGFKVRLSVINAGQLDGPREISEFFEVVGATASDYTINWTLGAENFLSFRFPNRRQMRDRCSWRYKSAECGYKGSLPSCDLTLQGDNGCAVHSNTMNFGGYPAIRNR